MNTPGNGQTVPIREFLDERINNVQRQVEDLKEDMDEKHAENREALEEIRDDVKTLVEAKQRAEGSLLAFKWLAGIGGIGGIAAFLDSLLGKP